MNDFKSAIRRLLAAPVFTIFSITTLALGIGVTTAAYTSIYVLAARPLGIRDQSRIVYLTRSNSVSAAAPAQLSWPDYLDLGRQPRSFADPIAWADAEPQVCCGTIPSSG